MPRINQRFLDCSIYLYPSKEFAENGERFGGSGFLVSLESNPIYDPASFKHGRYTKVSVFFPPHLYAVTNKHVALGCRFIRLNAANYGTTVVELDPPSWVYHPDGDDLAVASIELPGDTHRYSTIDVGSFVHKDSIGSFVGAGDDTFMVGRFTTHGGKQRNTPSLRFGSIAMMPFEKIRLENGYMQEAFLVETRSISGYSGSPVFVYQPLEAQIYQEEHYEGNAFRPPVPSRTTKSITDLVGTPTLLGIDCGHVQRYEDVVNGMGTPHQQWRVKSNTGMAIVIPAWRLLQLLDVRELFMQRKQKDKEWQEQKEAEESGF